MKQVQVTFLPKKVTLVVPIGSSVLDVALDAKLPIASPCNGRGTCGQCRVRVSNPRAVRITEAERFHLTVDDIKQGYRLACQTRLASDVNVEVLPVKASRYQFQVYGITRNFEKQPVVRKYRVKPSKATLKDPVSDDMLLLRNLREQHKLTGLTYHLDALRTLSDTRSEDSVDVVVRGKEIVDVRNAIENIYGIAVDVGTTKIACYIVDLIKGETLAADAIINPQRAFGEDVISRLTFEAKNDQNWKVLQESLVQGINDLIKSLSNKIGISNHEIYEAVVVGNTVMHHTFLGVHPVLVGRSPYSPTVGKSVDLDSRSVGLNIFENAKVHLPPNISGFVGADCVADILSTGLYGMKGLNLLIDIGTNTEIILANNRFMYACSCASGPAFEGYNITHGVNAIEGAVDRVHINEENYDVEYSTIAEAHPIGICGSGIIDSIAGLLQTGIIDERGCLVNNVATERIKGKMNEREFVIVPSEKGTWGVEITIKQTDIREVQLAKAAIYAGIHTLLNRAKVKFEKLDRVFVAGSFGSYMNISNAQMIGMLPDIPIDKFVQVGNSAGAGARQILLSSKCRETCEKIARKVSYVELANEREFKNEYIRASYLPHKDPSEFPNVTKRIKLER